MLNVEPTDRTLNVEPTDRTLNVEPTDRLHQIGKNNHFLFAIKLTMTRIVYQRSVVNPSVCIPIFHLNDVLANT